MPYLECDFQFARKNSSANLHISKKCRIFACFFGATPESGERLSVSRNINRRSGQCLRLQLSGRTDCVRAMEATDVSALPTTTCCVGAPVETAKSK